MTRPLAVAITGGIGAGKSEALRAFARRGVPTISADDVVHRLYEDEEVRRAVGGRFGAAVLRPDGTVDRRALAERVFADPGELAWLEGLLHPRAREQSERWRTELASLPSPPTVCVAEIPLLYETGGETRFDAVVAISAPPRVRHARTRKTGQAGRERRLVADEEKLRRADFAFVNDGTLEQLDRFVAETLAELERRAAAAT